MITTPPPSRAGLRSLAKTWALPAILALVALAASPTRADVVFTRSTTTGEHWAAYSATYTAPYTGNYTLGFNLTAGGPSGDNSILIDTVKVTNGATTVFSDGFETPALGTNTSVHANGGTATFGNWGFITYSGILDGSPPNWGLAPASSDSSWSLGTADGTAQYAFLQAAGGKLSQMKTANAVSLVAGQTYTISFSQASRRDFGGTTTYTVTLDFLPPTVYASGISPVIAYDPIIPATAYPNWTLLATPVPAVGYNANWVNPHPASSFPIGTHPWEFYPNYDFTANWINAWDNISSRGPGGHSWTKYTTTVYGNGDFVLQFLADNASWIYIDGQLVGYQDLNWNINGTGRYTIRLTGSGAHELAFIILDGGGAAGGKFRLETTQSFIDNNPGDPLPPPPPIDATAPVITAPADIVAEATSAAGATVTFSASATDNKDGTVPVTAAPASGSVFPLGTTAVGLAASDAAGNTATAEFDITVRDTTAPVIAATTDITAEATSADGAAVTYALPSATDLVGNVAVTSSPASGSVFPLGTTSVSLSAADSRANASSASFTVTVRDTTAPALTAPASVTIEATSAAGAVATFAASATDAVGVTSIAYSHASGSTFPLGSTTVAVSASDAAGNTSSGSFTVTVVDTTAPALSVPANQTLEATSAAGAVANFAATATDAVGVTSLTTSAASGSTFALGTTTVTVVAKDAAGNTSTGSFTVTVRDTTAPAIASVTPSIRAIWPPNKKMVPVTVSVSATDVVGIASAKIVSVATNQPDRRTQWQITGPLAVNLLADREGDKKDRVYTITIEVRDAAGNVSTATTTVIVPHDQRDKEHDHGKDRDHDRDDDKDHDKDRDRDDHDKGRDKDRGKGKG